MKKNPSLWASLPPLLSMMTMAMASIAYGGSMTLPLKKKQNKYEIPVTTSLIPLNHKDNNLRAVGQLHYMGGLNITSPKSSFGGISSFVISPDGAKILGISDRGRWLVADMVYDTEGQLQDIQNAQMAPLKDLKGAKKYTARDAEAVTAVDGAGFVVSFESPHTLRYFQANRPEDFASLFSANAQKITFAPDLPKAYASLPLNLGIEALTTLADGRMLAFSEHTTPATKDSRQMLAQGWIIGHGKVEPIRYGISPSYRPTDMATLPNGDILVLERHFSLARGMAARLTRLPAMSINAGATIKGEVIADLAFPFNLDNMEALAVRQNDAGETLIYIMSDNNFNRLQRNLLMMFKLNRHATTGIKKAVDQINGFKNILAKEN